MVQIRSVDINHEEGLLSLEEPLLKLRKNQLPNDIERFISILYTGVLQVKEDYAAAEMNWNLLSPAVMMHPCHITLEASA